MKLVLTVFLSLLFAPLLHAQGNACPPRVSHISIASGSLSPQPNVTFHLRHFVATLVPRGKTAPDCYQKTTVVSHAEIFVSNGSLTEVFTSKLGQTENKIKDFKVQNGLGKVTLSGDINKVIPIHFSLAGPVTTDGKVLLLDAKDIKADGIPIKGLLALVGEHLSAVLKFKGMNGITIHENTLAFDPEQIAHLKGFLTSVDTSPEGITLHYGSTPATHASAHPVPTPVTH